MFEWDEQVGIFSGDGDDVRHFEAPLLSPPGKADSGMWLGQDGTFRAVTWRSMNRWCQRKARYEMVDRVLPELNALRSGVYGANPRAFNAKIHGKRYKHQAVRRASLGRHKPGAQRGPTLGAAA